MAKSFIHIRVDEDVKETFEVAARRQGKTLTTFVLDAALKMTNKVPKEQPSLKTRFGGVPTYFRGWCQEAARGGEWGYGQPAYHLAIHLENAVPRDTQPAAWSREIGKLVAFLKKGENELVWIWFQERFPRCMELVPRRRWRQFVRGVYAAYEEGRIG